MVGRDERAASPPGVGGGSYANDKGYDATAQSFRSHQNNAKLVNVHDSLIPTVPVTFLQATRNIAVGEEIGVDYGRSYWIRQQDENR